MGIKAFRKFISLSVDKKLIFSEALFWLVFADITIKILPFKLIIAGLEKQNKQVREATEFQLEQQTAIVSRAIRKVARIFPWEMHCLQRAVAAKMMLDRRRINSTVYIGISKDNKLNMKAHAWLKVKNYSVSGTLGIHGYQIIAHFGGEIPNAGPAKNYEKKGK